MIKNCLAAFIAAACVAAHSHAVAGAAHAATPGPVAVPSSQETQQRERLQIPAHVKARLIARQDKTKRQAARRLKAGGSAGALTLFHALRTGRAGN